MTQDADFSAQQVAKITLNRRKGKNLNYCQNVFLCRVIDMHNEMIFLFDENQSGKASP